MVRKKRRYANIFTGEAVTETTQKMRKDEYVDIGSGKIRRKKKKSLL